MSAQPTLHLGVLGYGLVGKEFVSQVLGSQARLSKEMGVQLKIAAVARSKTMELLEDGGEPSAWFAGGDVPLDLRRFASHVSGAAAGASMDQALIVDNTASDATADLYEEWLSTNISVATPNKRAGSGPFDRYERISAAARESGTRFLCEATVGAGLPIIGPLQTLRRAGDKVKSVEGIFSGTLSFIFNTWKPGLKFSDVVAEASAKGFTEPDPRDDLGGTDVQRKVVILARELGLRLELSDVPVESLVPAELQSWSAPAGANLAEAFVQELRAFDERMEALVVEAEAAGEVLRYVGVIDVEKGKASVKLGRYPKTHPFASTMFADNIVTFDTAWYSPRPLVIQGPGAGAAVTAAGILGNVMEVMQGLRRPS